MKSREMAFSSSIQRAQAIKLCELCNENKIKWRCIDCDRCLCQKCITIHLKVSGTGKHQKVTIETPIKEFQRKCVTDNIPCKDHVTNMTLMFCTTCDSLVCPECVSNSHTNHKFITIEKAFYDKLEQLREIQTKVSDNLKLCDSKTAEIKSRMPKYDSLFDESVTKIKQQEQKLKEIISSHSKVLPQKVEDERSKVKTIMTKVEQEVNETRKKLEDMLKELETALKSNQGKFILETSFLEPVLNFDSLPHEVENFIPEAKTERHIQDLFGSFKTKTISSVIPEIVFEVLKTFTTDLPSIQQVVPLDETSAWIKCDTPYKSVLRKVCVQDNNIITTNETKMEVYDMALTSDNDLILSVGESDVKMMTKSGKIKHFLSVSPLVTRGIHVTRDNQVIVGVKELGNQFTPTEQSERAIIVYDKEGKQIHIYQKDTDGKRLFTYPFRVITNNNQDILVIDRTSDHTGRVVKLDREGNLRWIYEGHPTTNDTKSFDPMGITTTAAGHIIVSDYGTNALHVLSENGKVLTCKVMDGMGIMYPVALNIDKGGKLWIGCGTGGVDSGAKLHIVKLNY